eukprot:scaffold103299_cov63-Phaeocystis_antarctica.AAC.2
MDATEAALLAQPGAKKRPQPQGQPVLELGAVAAAQAARERVTVVVVLLAQLEHLRMQLLSVPVIGPGQSNQRLRRA